MSLPTGRENGHPLKAIDWWCGGITEGGDKNPTNDAVTADDARQADRVPGSSRMRVDRIMSRPTRRRADRGLS